jgi:hypothetical protein
MGITKQIRAQKRQAAEARHAEYAKLTLEQKLARAGAKEKAKLLKKAQK